MRCYIKHFAYISVIKVQNFCGLLPIIWLLVCFCPLYMHKGLYIRVKDQIILSWTYLNMARQPRLSHLASPAWNSRFGVCDQEAIQPRDHAKGGRGTLTRLLPQRTELCSSSSIFHLCLAQFLSSQFSRFLMNSMNSPINMLLSA